MKQPLTSAPWLSWLVWGLGAAFFSYGFFQRVAPSIMIDHLMRDLALTGAAVGNLSAFYFYTYATLQIPIGLLVDRAGPRRLLAFGALCCVAGTLLFSLATTTDVAFLGRALVGTGAATSFVCAITLAARWFPATRFAQFTGFTMMLGMAGGLLGQAPLAGLVETLGWREALQYSAIAGLLLAAAIWWFVRDFPAGAAGVSERATGSLLAALARVVGRRQNALLALITCALSTPNLAFGALWGVPWLMQVRGLDRAEAGATASLVLFGFGIGAPLSGWLSDRLGRRKPVILLGLSLALLSMLVLLYLPDLPQLAMWSCFLLVGAAGSCISAVYALARNHNPVSEIGTAFGFINGANVGSGAIFQPLIGVLLDAGWSGGLKDGARLYEPETFQMALSSIPIFLGLTLIAALFVREGAKA